MNKERIGHVYILSNDREIDIFKVGKSLKSPEVRADQLSRQTGSIGNYKVEWKMKSA